MNTALRLILISMGLLLFSGDAHAQRCVSWLLCPYKTFSDDPRGRYLALDDHKYEPGTTWDAIPTEGAGDFGVGQAVICVLKSKETKKSIEDAAESVGCTKLNPSQVKPLLKAWPEPYWDSGSNSMKLYDGGEGREKRTRDIKIPGNIKDPLVR